MRRPWLPRPGALARLGVSSVAPNEDDHDRALRLMMADLITVNDARRRCGNEPIPGGDVYFSEWGVWQT